MSKVKSRIPKIALKLNHVVYGKNLVLGGWPFIYRFPKGQITIGDDCSINSNFLSNLIGLYQRTIIIARGEGKIEIMWEFPAPPSMPGRGSRWGIIPSSEPTARFLTMIFTPWM